MQAHNAVPIAHQPGRFGEMLGESGARPRLSRMERDQRLGHVREPESVIVEQGFQYGPILSRLQEPIEIAAPHGHGRPQLRSEGHRFQALEPGQELRRVRVAFKGIPRQGSQVRGIGTVLDGLQRLEHARGGPAGRHELHGPTLRGGFFVEGCQIRFFAFADFEDAVARRACPSRSAYFWPLRKVARSAKALASSNPERRICSRSRGVNGSIRSPCWSLGR